MNEEYARRLLHSAVTSIKSGELKLARQYLERLFLASRDPDRLADGWYYMSQTTDDKEEKRKALEEALSYRLTHARARRAIAVLDGKLKEDEIINPDAATAPMAGDSAANADRFTCPNCGARMSFAPDGQSLVCDFCESGGAVDASGNEAEEKDFFSTMATLRGHSKPTARKVFHCDGCGAEFILPPNDISESCAYCASPHVISHSETRELLDPDAILPHAFDKRRATQLLVKWVEKNGFVPEGKVLPPRGFYLPVWTFDFAGYITYSGQRTEKKKQGYQEQIVTVTERGEYPVYIDDLVLPANHDYQELVLALIDTYDFTKSKPYDNRYLANWAAEAYEIALGDASLEARSRAYQQYKKKVERSKRKLSNLSTSSANLAIDSYKLLMLPVWMTIYSVGGKEYHVLINGQQGAVQGELPPPPEEENPKKKRHKFLDWLNEEI